MLLPGIQALFGFQLIAVFNAKFWALSFPDRLVHLAAIGLLAIAIALVMTPAAYHRVAFRNSVSQSFIDRASRLLLWGMLSLMLGTCLDFYLISMMILSNVWWAMGLSLVLLSLFASLWFVLPYLQNSRAVRIPAEPAAARDKQFVEFFSRQYQSAC